MCYSAEALTLCKQCADEFGASGMTRSRRQVVTPQPKSFAPTAHADPSDQAG